MGILLTANDSALKGAAMASCLIAGRVSEECKERAEYFIRRAGLTNSEVIRIVWENIAHTGEIPQPIDSPEAAHVTDNPLIRRLHELRASTPRSEFLESLSAEDMRRMVRGRDDI